jgi:4-carboxymuconolactone decarboxylase
MGADGGECRVEAPSDAPAGRELYEVLCGEVGEVHACAVGKRVGGLIILRVAHLQDSPYALGQHLELARAAGLTDAEIDAITGDVDAAGFGQTERVVLDVVTELCTTNRLRGDTFAAAHAALGDAAVTELLMLISCYFGLALVLDAADLETDPAARLHV